jgi:hypothetical protein
VRQHLDTLAACEVIAYRAAVATFGIHGAAESMSTCFLDPAHRAVADLGQLDEEAPAKDGSGRRNTKPAACKRSTCFVMTPDVETDRSVSVRREDLPVAAKKTPSFRRR